jgi:competence protein ComEA
MISGVPVDRHVHGGECDPAAGTVQSVGFAAAMCLCAVAGLALLAKTNGISRPEVPIEIDSRVNPNDASTASLARLPGIGQARARAIVSYRSQFPRRQNRPAFLCPEDLQVIPGIGPATTEAIRPWLSFSQRAEPARREQAR